MAFKDTPIRRKLMIIILLTSVLVMVMMRLSFFIYEYLTFRAATMRQLSTLGEVTAANSTASLAFENQEDAKETLAALKAEPNIVAACLYNKDGRLFSKYPDDLSTNEVPDTLGMDGYRFGGSHLVGFQPVIQGDKRLGTLYLSLDTGSMMHDWLLGSIGIAAVIMSLVLLMTYMVSRTLQKQISQPILSLAETARAVAERRDFSVRAIKQGEDELGLLTDAFNRMLGEIHKLNTTLEQRVTERTAQLEAVNKELEAFSYSVSHDLRAPLRHINGFADMLHQESAANLSASGKRYLSVISDSAKRMGTLIDDLLVFSRMGRSEMLRTTMNMNELVAEVLREMSDDLTGRNIKWDIGLLPEAVVDRAMLKQVWVNLFSNAVKYTRQREQAEIKVSCKKNAQAEWEFSVQDNGAGFDMRYANKLFGVFQRLHQVEEFEGTGIGLANVRRIVLRHGGRVWAEAKVDEGATFYFTLPDVESKKDK